MGQCPGFVSVQVGSIRRVPTMAPDALSWVPISHSRETIQSLLQGAIVGAANRGEVRASEELLEEHEHLSQEARVQAAKLAPMHIIDWAEAQEADATLAACHKWLCLRRDMLLPKRDALFKKCLGTEAETEQGKTLFHICNSLVLNKGLMYMSKTPKGETEGVLAFVVPVGQHHMALNGVHHDTGHQGQQRTLALAQERFWWSMMAEDCHELVRGCPCCQAFEGEVPKVLLCPIRAYSPLELMHLDYTSIESTMELNKPLVVRNVHMITNHFMRYTLVVVTKDQTAKTVTKVFYEHFIAVFGVPAKLLINSSANFMSALTEELCATFGLQCRTTTYHAQCNGQVECFHQMLFHMIGKLVRDKRTQWEQHLLELLQAYNSTQSAVTSFLLHYLIFGRCHHLPVDYYFPMASVFKCSHCVPAYVMEVRRRFKEAYAEAHLQTNCEAEKQKWYYDRTTRPGNVVLMKNDAYQGKQKVKDQWSETVCGCPPSHRRRTHV